MRPRAGHRCGHKGKLMKVKEFFKLLGTKIADFFKKNWHWFVEIIIKEWKTILVIFCIGGFTIDKAIPNDTAVKFNEYRIQSELRDTRYRAEIESLRKDLVGIRTDLTTIKTELSSERQDYLGLAREVNIHSVYFEFQTKRRDNGSVDGLIEQNRFARKILESIRKDAPTSK